MRFYVHAIQFNKEAQAENRTVPKACDTLNEALTAYHDQLTRDHKNKTLGWSMVWITSSISAKPIKEEEYVADPDPVEIPAEETVAE